MKKIFTSLFIISLSINAFSITNTEINKLCQEERNKFLCVKRLKVNRLKLKEGNLIEIPVIPYRR
tara:strand:- start:369 stop:563 length:195 start_codon:yes stop_codon:yes gene_type:complete